MTAPTVGFPPVFHKMRKDINDGKKYHFAENRKYQHMMKMRLFLMKARRKIRHNHIDCQFADSHDSGQYGRVKKSQVPLHDILGEQKNKIGKKVHKGIQPYGRKHGYCKQKRIKTAQHDKPDSCPVFRDKKRGSILVKDHCLHKKTQKIVDCILHQIHLVLSR